MHEVCASLKHTTIQDKVWGVFPTQIESQLHFTWFYFQGATVNLDVEPF